MPPGSQSFASIVEKAVTVAPSGVKPLTRDQVMKLPTPFTNPGAAANPNDSLPPLPTFEQPVLQTPPVEVETPPVQPRTVRIPKNTVEPIILTNPSSAETKPPAP